MLSKHFNWRGNKKPLLARTKGIYSPPTAGRTDGLKERGEGRCSFSPGLLSLKKKGGEGQPFRFFVLPLLNREFAPLLCFLAVCFSRFSSSKVMSSAKRCPPLSVCLTCLIKMQTKVGSVCLDGARKGNKRVAADRKLLRVDGLQVVYAKQVDCTRESCARRDVANIT